MKGTASPSSLVRSGRVTGPALKLLSLLSIGHAVAASAQIPKPADAPQPLTPEASAAAFRLPDGFRMDVVASEPLIASPTGVCWDERGRMFVTELHGYNLEGQLDIDELNKTGKLDTQVRRVEADEKFKKAAKAGTYGVLKMLRDTDGDGHMDAVDVWATHLPPAYGLVPARGGIIVACAPDIIYLSDRDGDGVPEVRETLFTGFRVGEMWRGINSPQWGADGWIYFGRGWGGSTVTGPRLREPVRLPDTDFRIRADGSAIEPVTGGTGTFGFALTTAGDRFTENTTIPAIYVAPLPWRYLARNPDAATASLESATGDRRVYERAPPHPWRQKRADDPAYFKYYNSRYGAAESEAAGWFTAACGPLVYRDRALPGLQGQYFVCEPAGNLIHRALIEADGSALKVRRAPGEEKSEFAATSDQWSHPINLRHGPDGSIWVVDFYREIIEDYSAIPRHLQQQYGVYHGHDRGRIYRLTHRDAPKMPAADLSVLDGQALVEECASPLLWRRQTAQRLLVEHGDTSAAPRLRSLLKEHADEPETVITALRTLDLLGGLTPEDVIPFLRHADPAVRVHALQLGDRWLSQSEDRGVLDALLTAASDEANPRVQIQVALSLGESRDPRSFDELVTYARKNLGVRWMNAALLSSLHGRPVEMLAALLREPGGASAFRAPLVRSIAAGRNEADLARALSLIASTKPDTQAALLGALTEGRKNAPRKPLTHPAAQSLIASFETATDARVRAAAVALAGTFVPGLAEEDAAAAATTPAAVETVSDETFREYVAALAGPRDLARGREVFTLACAMCHRIGGEGHEVGPDLLGQVGMADESLLQDILLPNTRIRPGYETTWVQLTEGSGVTGVLKDDGATSLTLLLPGGVERVLLRKDVKTVRRLNTSLMPSFAGALSPADVANLLAWLKSQLGGSSPAASLEAYRAELTAFRAEYGGARELPDIRFFLFGMGQRAKLLYRDGRLTEATTGRVIREWPVRSDLIVPPDYLVAIETSDGAQVMIREDESAVWIETNGNREAVAGTRSPVQLPLFTGHRHGSVLRVLHQELLMNITAAGPVPNFFVYSKPWYRDGAMMAMALKKTDNLDLIRDWVLGLREPYDRNNHGEEEADNLGQALYLISLVSDRNHPLVAKVLAEVSRFEVNGPNGRFIKGRSDFAEHPVYQTKWLKYGLRALGLPDPYTVQKVKDGYSALFWMDYRDDYVPGDSDDRGNYPYLGWACDHFHGTKKSPISNRDYPLTWEQKASQANYPGLQTLDPVYVGQKVSAPHTWHAAEVFLYLLDQ